MSASALGAVFLLLVAVAAGVLLLRLFWSGQQRIPSARRKPPEPTTAQASRPWTPSGQAKAPVPGRIFLCYRREDSSGYTGRIYDQLAQHFDPGQVFMDIDSIDPGLDFTKVVNMAVAGSAAVVAVIGRTWLSAADEHGRRRLDDPADHVRHELSAALARNTRVIPVLVQGARMPTVGQLPEPLQPLANRNAIELSDTRWRFDMEVLTKALDRAVAQMRGEAGVVASTGGGAPSRRPIDQSFRPQYQRSVPRKQRSYLIRTIAGVAALLLAGILAWQWLSDMSHAVGVPAPLAQLVVSSHSYPVRSMVVCSDGVLPGLVVEVILDHQTSEVPIVTWGGVTAKGKTIYPGTPLVLKVSNGRNCPPLNGARDMVRVVGQ